MKHSYFCLFLFLLCSSNLFAQREASNWYFGDNAGLQFNPDGSVTPLTDGALNTLEGCAVISDRFGDLLFYTDGVTVWDKEHQIMPGGTGLFGDSSSSQSAIIVPQPESNSIYHIFTVAGLESGETIENDLDKLRGLNFYTVDLEVGANGTVVNHGNNGQPLLVPNAEKVTAVRASDCSSIWVITHFEDKFYAYNVSQSGANTTPVISTVPLNVPFSGYRFNAIGYLKASPDGSKLGIAHSTVSNTPNSRSDGALVLYDFNTTTGQVTNEVILDTGGGRPYGVEFSPNNKVFYGAVDFIGSSGNNQQIFQFNLDAIDISGSRFSLGVTPGGALQLAANGKIYHANAFQGSLNVVDRPNELGPDANFRLNAQPLGGRTTTFGLPPFIQSLFNEVVNITGETNDDGVFVDEVTICQDEDFLFSIQDPIPGASYAWFFDNGTSEIALPCGTPDCSVTNAQAANSGRYRVEIDPMDGSCPIEGFGFLNVISLPSPIFSELVQCDVDPSNSTDGKTVFNLEEAINDLTQGLPGLNVLFFKDAAALAANIPIDNPVGYINTTPFSQVLSIRLTTEGGCTDTGTLLLTVRPTTSSLPDLGTFYNCDLNSDPTVLESSFDLDQIKADNYPTTLDVTFYTSLLEASLEMNPVSGNQFRSGSAQIFVRIENANECQGIEQFTLVVDPAPTFNFPEEVLLCFNQSPKLLEAPRGFDTYAWTLGSTVLSTTAEVSIDSAGTYQLEVGYTYETDGVMRSCTASKTFTVTTSDLAVFTDIEVTDVTANNTIAVSVSGGGDFEYALNFPNGPYQEASLFENVAPGVVTVYVRDRNGCGIVSEQVSVVGFPRFFTPNNDGFHDFWQVLGVSSQFQANSEVIIFDRFGKTIAAVNPRGRGWDGTYQGEPLPSGGFWFSVKLEDGRDFTGYFALIRR